MLDDLGSLENTEDRADPPRVMKDLLNMIIDVGEAIMKPRNFGAFPVDEIHE